MASSPERYAIGGYGLEIISSGFIPLSRILPSFNPFQGVAPVIATIRLYLHGSNVERRRDFYSLLESPPLESADNYFGHMEARQCAGQWIISLKGGDILVADDSFRHSEIYLGKSLSCAALSSLIHVAWCHALLFTKCAAILHASCIISADGEGILFLAPSGTGKSTQSGLWISSAGASLLNDDNPLVRILADGRILVYGSPWSGKTPCYRSEGVEATAFFRIERSAENSVIPLRGLDAFNALLPSFSSLRSNNNIYPGRIHGLIARLAAIARVGFLRCRPDSGAVEAVRVFLSR